MAKGTIYGSTGNQYIDAKIEWSSSANNTANTSSVTAKLYYKRNNTGFTTYGSGSFSITIDGEKQTQSTTLTITESAWVLAMTATKTVSHGNDGKKSTTISAAGSIPDTSLTSTSCSGRVTLDTIPRASAITSASNVTLGNACNVKWTPASASFRYKVKFELGEWSYTTSAIHPNTISAYTYKGYSIPLDVADQIPDVRVGTMTATLYTYSDTSASTQVGDEASKKFTVTVPDNSSTKPTVSMNLSPVGSLPSSFAGLYIQGLTKVKATLSAEGRYGASIESYLMRVDGVYIDADDAFTSRYFTTAGSRTVYGYATDKRGHTGEVLKPITVIAYSDPKLENTTAVRCDQNGNDSESGTYLKISAKRSYSPVVSNDTQKNFCKIMYRYSNGLSYGPWVTILDRDSLDSNEVTTGALLDGALSTQASYTVQVRAIDDIGRYADTYITIPTEKIYWHRDGARNALGLGKYNERDNALDTDWDFYMNNHRITGLPTPTSGTDAVPKSYVDPADIRLKKSLNAAGWYKIGTMSGSTDSNGNTDNMCVVVTLTVGGLFVNNQASPSMVDIATQHNQARSFLRIPALADNQISKIALIQEKTTTYGVYAYYNSNLANTVSINVHTHMGVFVSENFTASSVAEGNMLAVVTLKE